jgi:hypothetical protein
MGPGAHADSLKIGHRASAPPPLASDHVRHEHSHTSSKTAVDRRLPYGYLRVRRPAAAPLPHRAAASRRAPDSPLDGCGARQARGRLSSPAPAARYASSMETEAPTRPPLLRRAVALLVLVAAVVLAIHIVIGLVMAVFWVAVAIAVAVAVLWALKTIVW